jgi:serine O-acetyltransferase
LSTNSDPAELPLLRLIREDLVSHGGDWTRPGFRALAVYRFGVWRMKIRTKLVRAPFSVLYRCFYRHVRNHYGIELPYSVRVGRRVVIEHQSGIVIHGASVIGDECVIRQNCTLGVRRTDQRSKAPVLGRGVDLGAGAVLLGDITVGDFAIIGANAVVLCDVPAGAIAVGVPAVVKPQKANEGAELL